MKYGMPVSILMGALLALSGCAEPDSKATLTDYQQRLNRVLQLENISVQAVSPDTLPRPSELKQPLPDIRMDLTDAWASRECGLDQLVGERNSGLGRVFQPSKQLNYELRLLARLQHCQEQQLSETLQQQISDWRAQKEQSAVLAYHNMLLSDDTLRQQWHSSSKRLIPAQTNGFIESTGALKNLLNLQQLIHAKAWQHAAEVDIEQSLAILHQHDFLARLQNSLRFSAAWFEQVNPQLLAIAPASLCQNGRNTQQLTILSTVFSKFFIANVQAHLAELRRFNDESWPLIAQLYRDTPLFPALQQRYQQPAAQLQQQLILHVNWWQQLNKQCPVNLTPGA